MHDFVFGLEILAAAVILLRSIQIGSMLAWKEWSGHPLQFIGKSICYPLMAGGAAGILFERHWGYLLLLIGVMILMLSERRRQQ